MKKTRGRKSRDTVPLSVHCVQCRPVDHSKISMFLFKFYVLSIDPQRAKNHFLLGIQQKQLVSPFWKLQ
jgi:hypothetical protein